ncbi:hypothetical protein FXN63_02420 [Pigmentiphaga aceris]|uniref:Uncharacterized protein n=1 Tax=Pigmentiphaga aceris TaxID=1940612 RepID=A0A5C0ARN8_9BURK|nr:hypothetical protein [Pigmentiphaga aceris]QEI04822.1 hypothetical protein FXN63_02420 [Pigmentiphaga aceris]
MNQGPILETAFLTITAAVLTLSLIISACRIMGGEKEKRTRKDVKEDKPWTASVHLLAAVLVFLYYLFA